MGRRSCQVEPPGRYTPHCCYLGSVGGLPSARGSLVGVNLRTHPLLHTAARERGWPCRYNVSSCLFGSFAFVSLFIPLCLQEEGAKHPDELLMITPGACWIFREAWLLLLNYLSVQPRGGVKHSNAPLPGACSQI